MATSVAWNYAGYAFQLVVNFGLTAYVVRRVSVAEYGIFLLVMSLSATMNLLDLGISGVLVQNYVRAIKNHGQPYLNELMSTSFVMLGLLGFFGLLIFTGFALFLPGPFRIPSGLLHEAALIFVIAALTIQFRLPNIALRQVFQSHGRFDRINQFSLFTATLQVVLSVAVLYCGFGVIGLASVQLASAILQIGIYTIALPHVVPGSSLSPFRFRPEFLGALIQEGKWAFLSNVAGYLVEIGIWGILGSFGSMTEVALYGIAFKAPNQLWNLADRGADVLLPILSEYAAKEDYPNLRRVFLITQQLLFGAVLPFVILGCIFAKSLIELWVGKQYTDAAFAMRWLLIAVLAHVIAHASDLMLYACRRVRLASWISASGGALTCLIGLVLVPFYGATGMGASLAISMLISTFGWYTILACRISNTSVGMLSRSLINGLGGPVLVLATEALLIFLFRKNLSPLWTTVAATASGGVYFLLWGLRTALPLYRKHAERIA
jgi:O-antigen/teichoic acid export membrane protein